jgi:hypothetical protein
MASVFRFARLRLLNDPKLNSTETIGSRIQMPISCYATDSRCLPVFRALAVGPKRQARNRQFRSSEVVQTVHWEKDLRMDGHSTGHFMGFERSRLADLSVISTYTSTGLIRFAFLFPLVLTCGLTRRPILRCLAAKV